MSRIPYQASDMTDAQGLADSIRKRRGGQLYNLDRMLLHSAPLARGWHGFLPAVRGELEVSKKLGELAICFVAVLNEADYEFIHHAPVFLSAGGNEAQLAALRSPEAAVVDQQLFSSVERATLKLTLEMTRSVKVSDETFAMIRSQLANEQQLVEIVGVVAAYNMVSRFLVALGVDPE